jgi:hypothetical protein
MRSISIFGSLIVSVLVAACSSPAPEPTLYLMRGAASGRSGRVEAQLRVGIGRIIVAPYLLSSAGLVVETAPGEVRAARLHQWAEPLDAGLRWFLRGEIARALGYEVGGGLVDRSDWDYAIDVYVARLHGTMSGTALLEGAYVIRSLSGTEPLRDHLFSKSLPLDDEGYAALAAAEQRLVTELARSIAASLQEMQPQPAME